MTKTLSPKEVAFRLGITGRTLRRWIAEGLFPSPIRINRRILRWRPEVVAHWLSAKEGRS